MPKRLLRNAALTIACLLVTAGAGSAQQRYYSTVSATPYGSTYQSPAASSIIGRYTSDAFYPSPLVLTITGMDRYGNLSGSIWGMSTKPQNGWDPAYDYWQKVFGRNARAYYRNGWILIAFDNGATYRLNANGMELRGQFDAKNEHRDVTFLKGSSVAVR